MKSIGKITLKITMLFVLLLLVIIGGSWIYHSYAVKQEINNAPPPGKMVNVNNHDMHVYQEGDGPKKIVFLSGSGTSAPMLDFKPLWSRLSADYSIAVVEKAGYGWSEIATVSREIDDIVEESRAALKLADVRPPYVLAAHSMSAIEAIRWAQQYPNEVDSIIGLDPAIPTSYDVFSIPSTASLFLPTIFARSGLIRFVPSFFNQSAAIASGYLSEEDEEAYRALFYRRTLTSNMVEEMKQVKKNASIVEAGGVPTQVPMLFFISNGKEVAIDNWEELLSDYNAQLDDGKAIVLDVGHYVHAWEPTLIGEEIDLFLSNLEHK